ncbi:O-antigen ligase family protein [Roseomonas sp. E05]|uniref:O-antigen ligase family protein n=1 Tax=Roseomonas sp. E05 TaxID=3046310 RepID=UPI0024B8DC31|nr:O-antigen ligase family protein [Roseomonas sp. E05]MDJ0390008.1 O-antigen ligase family protein [Roseomonas sp. E05]
MHFLGFSRYRETGGAMLAVSEQHASKMQMRADPIVEKAVGSFVKPSQYPATALGPSFAAIRNAAAEPLYAAAPALVSARWMVLGIAVMSAGNFNPALFGLPDATVETAQKLVALGLWLALIAISFLPGTQRQRPVTTGLLLPVLVVGWVALSASWSGQPDDSLGKALVLLLTTFGAWRAATLLHWHEFFEQLMQAQLLLVLASIAVVIAMPSIGVLHNWQHDGLWSGIYISKQTLGTVAANLLFLCLLRLCYQPSPIALLGLLAGTAGVLGSGSRGGAVMAAAAVGCVLLARRSPRLAGLMSYLPILCLLLATAGITFILLSGLSYFPLFGTKVDLTERTIIWQFSLDAWTTRPWLGFGVQGFWTEASYYDRFLRIHGWVLDNYHSGYVNFLVEFGAIGFALLTGFMLVLCRKLAAIIAAAPALPSRARFAVEAAFGLIVLLFTINLTESFFMRATDFSQVTTTLLTIMLFAPRSSAPRLNAR